MTKKSHHFNEIWGNQNLREYCFRVVLVHSYRLVFLFALFILITILLGMCFIDIFLTWIEQIKFKKNTLDISWDGVQGQISFRFLVTFNSKKKFSSPMREMHIKDPPTWPACRGYLILYPIRQLMSLFLCKAQVKAFVIFKKYCFRSS